MSKQRIAIGLLGGLRMGQGEQEVSLRRMRELAEALAYLACPEFPDRPLASWGANPLKRRVCTRDDLIQIVWSEAIEKDIARGRLRTLLTALRRKLALAGMPVEDVLLCEGETVSLGPDVSTDVEDFLSLLSVAFRTGDLAEKARRLTDAAGIFRGDLCPDQNALWLTNARESLAARYAEALDELARTLGQMSNELQANELADHVLRPALPVLDSLQRSVARLKTLDRMCCAVMRLCLLARRPQQALVRFETLVALMHGVDASPSAEAQGLREEAKQALRETSPRRLKRVPCFSIPLIGRQKERACLQQILEGRPPLVTLTGPPGVGKTRLAQEVIETAQELFGPAVYWVALQDVCDPHTLPASILSALTAERQEGDPNDQIVAVLAEVPTLLILDNLEHLLPAAVPWIREMLSRAPLLTCLVTSRSLLKVEGETELKVSPLKVPAADALLESCQTNPSVSLFVACAQVACPDFCLTRENATAVRDLCRLLDGLPLNLSLVASRTALYSPAQMLTTLPQLLNSPSPNQARSRHRTLWAAIAWSYRLLGYDLATFFLRLSIFRGGWTMEAAREVCLEGLEEVDAELLLSDLLDQSLIISFETGQSVRFSMLQTLQEFAASELRRSPQEHSDVSRRHAEYYAHLANQSRSKLTGPEQKEWLDLLEGEHDNFRSALHWCQAEPEEGTPLGLKLAGSLWSFWATRGYLDEARMHLNPLLRQAEGAPPCAAHARTLNGAAAMLHRRGEYAQAYTLYRRSLSLYRRLENPLGMSSVLFNLAQSLHRQRRYHRACICYERSLAIERAHDNKEGIACALFGLGRLAWAQEKSEQARERFIEALAVFKEAGDHKGTATALNSLGLVEMGLEHDEAARACFEQALPLFDALDSPSGKASILHNLGLLSQRQGDFAAARTFIVQSLVIEQKLGHRYGIAESLGALASLARQEGQVRRAVILFGAEEALRAALRSPREDEDKVAYRVDLEALCETMGTAAFSSARETGQRLLPEQAVAYALQDKSVTNK